MKSISLVIALVCVVAAGMSLVYLRRGRIALKPTLFWLLLWFAIGFFALFPSVLDYFLTLAMMENRMVFLFVISIFSLFLMMYFLFAAQKKTDRTVAKLVQEVALLNFRLDQESGGLNSTPEAPGRQDQA